MIVRRALASCAITILGVVGTHGDAAAEGGYSGKSYWPGDSTCFGTDGYGGVTNVCSGAARTYLWYFSGASGTNHLEVRGTSGVACTWYEMDFTGAGAVNSGSATIVSAYVVFPGWIMSNVKNTIELRCNIPTNYVVHSVFYGP